MRSKNFRLLEVMHQKRITQCELVKETEISSGTRCSRIINRLVQPTAEEVRSICRFLSKEAKELGLESSDVGGNHE